MLIPEKVNSYLNKHSSNHWKLEWNKKGGIQNVVVIPAISEYENIQNLLLSLSENDKCQLSKTLILFVINNLKSLKEEVKENNRKTIEFLRAIIYMNVSDHLTQRLTESGLITGLVDASTEGNEFDDNTGGVGMARKVGMDLA